MSDKLSTRASLPTGRLQEERNHGDCLLIYRFFKGKEGRREERKKRETERKKERTKKLIDRGEISISTSFFKDKVLFC
jgi:hypothetical protein